MRVLAMAVLALGGAAMAQAPSFDPRAHRDFSGRASQVLVLGTPHLSDLPPAFAPATLTPVLDRLAAWRPDMIAVESLSGPDCEFIVRYKAIYQDTADQYCWDPAPATRATGLSVPAATAEARRLLAAWPAAPSPTARRHLAAVFLAGGDRTSALVQWLRLPAAERRAGDGLNDELVKLLEAQRVRRNENSLVAAPLAARLGLERVYPVDDHSADEGVVALGPGLEAALKDIWSGADRTEMTAVETGLDTPAGTLALYRFHNSPRVADLAFANDFGAALRHATPENYGRRYVGWWETRNLRMVANIRAALNGRPGGRMLAIVGSSHRGYYEKKLPVDDA